MVGDRKPGEVVTRRQYGGWRRDSSSPSPASLIIYCGIADISANTNEEGIRHTVRYAERQLALLAPVSRNGLPKGIQPEEEQRKIGNEEGEEGDR